MTGLRTFLEYVETVIVKEKWRRKKNQERSNLYFQGVFSLPVALSSALSLRYSMHAPSQSCVEKTTKGVFFCPPPPFFYWSTGSKNTLVLILQVIFCCSDPKIYDNIAYLWMSELNYACYHGYLSGYSYKDICQSTDEVQCIYRRWHQGTKLKQG